MIAMPNDLVPGEGELVARWQRGDAAALRQVMSDNSALLHNYAYRIVRNSSDAEEVVNDTFRRAHGCVAYFRGDCSLRTWLVKMVRNAAMNRYHYWRRRRRAESISLEAPLSDGGTLRYADVIPDHNLLAREMAEIAEFEREVEEAIPYVPVKQQCLLRLRMGGASYKEMADVAQVGIGTVKSRMVRAREALKAVMQPEVFQGGCRQ